MPAYAYPIHIDYNRRIIDYTTEHEITSITMTVEDLAFTDGLPFYISANGIEGYTVYVDRTRQETEAEYNVRIKRDEDYMKEYNRRKALKALKVN